MASTSPTPASLSTPLLSDSIAPAANGHATNHRHSHHHDDSDGAAAAASVCCDDGGDPFAFLAEDRPPRDRGAPSPADPFRNGTPAWGGGAYAWARTLLLLPVAAVRLVLFGLAIAIGYAATWVALRGWANTHGRPREGGGPMPAWRRRLMWITRISARCILFSFGYHWIRKKGRPAPRELAPIVVSNHISYIEPIFFFYELFPTIVSSESHDALPFVGTIIRAMQVIYVDRFSPASRKAAVNEIKRKAACNSFPRVLLFPEGTTTNGRFLISFQHGAFIPGYPVQPVVVRYPHVHFDQSWGNISLLKLMFKMFTQFHNFMEVEYLPVVYPPEIKQENALHFAEDTSYAMARALNVLPTSYSYGDSMIMARAVEAGKIYGVSTAEAMELLEHFLAMNPDNDGRVKAEDFWAHFGLDCSPLCKKIFHYFDLGIKESITFRQFLVGCAHLRKQPLFQGSCETAFEKCRDPETSEISRAQLADILRSSMLLPSDDKMVELFKTFDIDGDEKISRDDFMTCLGRFPFLIAFFAARINGEVYIEIV
ncbi:lysophospholipid acyltransferase LPEAT2 isoform X2 [Sorghum bicolor]|uniref:lysophospholipid acyltransferase LPEAT2 isoform X2 n=1 Tax=Sorghum bicolor TaxID=4558 RepID=UPI000B423DCA|nr:lysophospholipid acyltransferase LPEAT2 isoform X2 [Sorghum bicolor]|eukprot:XP_021304518.1 lysophospholipid acyltransferase LPEAT2 isoform X2 [Sorghum bicolor]